MKILQSKYFRPRKIMTENYRDNQYFIEVKELEQEITANNTPFEELIDSMMPNINFNGDNIVIKKEHLVKFVKCEDYHTVYYDSKSNTFYEGELCYFYPEFEFFLLLNEDLSNEYDKHIFESGFLKVEKLGYNSNNPNSLKNIKEFFNLFLEKYISSEAKILLLLKEGNDLVFRHQTIKPYKLDLELMYNDNFISVHTVWQVQENPITLSG